MATPGGRPPRVPVLIDPATWREEVERLAPASDARLAAERARAELEAAGIDRAEIRRCADGGGDGTALSGFVKVYVPIGGGPASAPPFGFVFSPAATSAGNLALRLIAFGERHPQRPATRSVYERAHRRRHGRYPTR